MIRSIRIVVGTAGLAALFTFIGTAHVLAADGGQVAFNTHCRTCHSTKEGDNRLGPPFITSTARKQGLRQAIATIRRASPAPGSPGMKRISTDSSRIRTKSSRATI
jgi:mono/diheme cytochrome c family protein